MKMLLTSGGINNSTISDALVVLLGKPISESTALCIPTAMHPMVNDAPGHVAEFIRGSARSRMCDLGWKSLGVLELTALPSIGTDAWVSQVQECDALLVSGGDALFLCHWIRQSGLAELIPSLSAVWVGLSAGSMVMTPSIGEDFVTWRPPTGGDETLGLVDFSICPHLAQPGQRGNSMEEADAWVATMSRPCYVIDDETAIQVIDGDAEIVTEGHWKLVTPGED